ncbi:MAG: formylglycine-generating enzyme family protein [Rhodoluna sp.]
MEELDSTCCSPQNPEIAPAFKSWEYLTEGALAQSNFVTIPSGEFLMGSDDLFYPTDGEGPARLIWLDEFKISQYSVTNADFLSFIKSTGYKTEAEIYGWSYVFKGFIDESTLSKKLIGLASSAPWWIAIEGAYWFKPFGNFKTIEDILDHPVVHVSHNDALEFCKWSGYKLPTEAQWEKASRGGLVGKLYPWGDDFLNKENHQANIWQGEFPNLNTGEDGFIGTAPVNSYQANNYGLYNTVGNVWEWTNDFWSARWHINESEVTRRNPLGPPKASSNRVLKGGSFMCHKSYCYRYRNSARTFNTPNTSTSHIGFRCVL